MVILNFRLTDIGRVSMELDGEAAFEVLLKRFEKEHQLTIGGTIATRAGVVLKASDVIVDGDEIDIYPAISGG